jgi:hypothetical protein
MKLVEPGTKFIVLYRVVSVEIQIERIHTCNPALALIFTPDRQEPTRK